MTRKQGHKGKGTAVENTNSADAGKDPSVHTMFAACGSQWTSPCRNIISANVRDTRAASARGETPSSARASRSVTRAPSINSIVNTRALLSARNTSGT